MTPPPLDEEATIGRLRWAIATFTAEHGYAPSTRDLCRMTEIPSTETVNKYLKIMRRRSQVTWAPRQSRTLRLVS